MGIDPRFLVSSLPRLRFGELATKLFGPSMLSRFRPAGWQIGRQIVEILQGGAARAEYGSRLLSVLADSLTLEFGRSLDVSNPRRMRVFYKTFPIRDALRSELSWT